MASIDAVLMFNKPLVGKLEKLPDKLGLRSYSHCAKICGVTDVVDAVLIVLRTSTGTSAPTGLPELDKVFRSLSVALPPF